MKFISRALFALLFALASTLSWAQAAYPSRPVQVIVAFPPGSGTDHAARIVMEKMSQLLGQQFILVNKPGAGGTLAEAVALAAPADGYTILVNSSAHTLYPTVYPDLKYDPVRDFVGVGPIGEAEAVLMVPASRKWNKLSDMVAYAKANPGKVTFGSAGVGTNTHLSFERLAIAGKFEALHVPFKGGGEALNELMAGRIDALYTTPMGAALAAVKSKQLVALASRSLSPPSTLPEVPSSVDAGYPDSDFASWVGVLAPAAVPKPIIERLNGALVTALKDPETAGKLNAAGIVAMPQTTAQFAAQLTKDFAVNAKLMKAVNAKAPTAK